MQVYTLDEGFRPLDVIDNFETILWTDRYAAEGDFVLTVPDTPDARAKLPTGRFLSISESREVMLIETRETKGPLLKVSGISLAGFLKYRMVRDTWWNGVKFWDMTGAPGEIMGEIVSEMCTPNGGVGIMYSGSAMTSGDLEMIPGLTVGELVSGTSVNLAVPYGSVYDAIKQIAESYSLGFAMYPSSVWDTGFALTFTTYAGRDLTSTQSANPVVRFEPALDSLTDTRELQSISGFMTVCAAWPPEEVTAQYYIVGVAYSKGGAATRDWNRRTMQIRVTDTGTYDPNTDPNAQKLIKLLAARAKDALANNNYVRMMDGQLVPQTGFTYGVDYFLGDIVELRAPTGESDQARVTEYIHSQDKNGYKAYPTLSVIE